MLFLRLTGSLRSRSFVALRSRFYHSGTLKPSARIRLLIGVSGASLFGVLKTKKLQCQTVLDNPWLLTPHVNPGLEKPSSLVNLVYFPSYLVSRSWVLFRKLIRCITLAIRFLPLVIAYPLACRVHYLKEIWWSSVLFVIQSSGPTFIKLGQWASTRRDIFSKEFCDRMSILHTKSRRQQRFRECDRVFDELFGEGFAKNYKKDVFLYIEPYSIGSGCISQIYKATVNVSSLEAVTGRTYPQLAGCEKRDVVIKVIEPGVEDEINLDLSILRNAITLLMKVVPSLEYMEPLSALSQFEVVLRRQVDLRYEAKALLRFSKNFDHKKTGIKFPVVIGYTKDVLLETFEDGICINRLVSEEKDSELLPFHSLLVRRRIALLGVRALLKMIFVDNFVHGDLHPGNILIRLNRDNERLSGVHVAPRSKTFFRRGLELFRDLIGWRASALVRFTDSPELADEPTLIMLDTGIVFSETENCLRSLKALFRAIIDKQGYKAGEMLLAHAENRRNCSNPHEFCMEVDRLVARAMKERSLRKMNISTLLSELFSLVAAYNVYLDSSFTSVVLSVMVLEGLGRSLDPDIDLFQCARPYLLNMV